MLNQVRNLSYKVKTGNVKNANLLLLKANCKSIEITVKYIFWSPEPKVGGPIPPSPSIILLKMRQGFNETIQRETPLFS